MNDHDIDARKHDERRGLERHLAQVASTMPGFFGPLVKARWRRAPMRFHAEMVQAAALAVAAAKSENLGDDECLRRADAALTQVRQPKGSRLGKSRSNKPGSRDRAEPTAAPIERPPPCDVEDLSPDEQGGQEYVGDRQWAARVLASLSPPVREFAEARFMRNESYGDLAKEFGIAPSAARRLTDEIATVLRGEIHALNRLGMLTPMWGMQAWKRDFYDWSTFQTPGGVAIPRGWEIRTVRGELEPRRADEREAQLQVMLSMAEDETRATFGELFPGLPKCGPDELHVFTVETFTEKL